MLMKTRPGMVSKLRTPEEKRDALMSGRKGAPWVISRGHKNKRLLQSEGRFLPLAGLGAAAVWLQTARQIWVQNLATHYHETNTLRLLCRLLRDTVSTTVRKFFGAQ